MLNTPNLCFEPQFIYCWLDDLYFNTYVFNRRKYANVSLLAFLWFFRVFGEATAKKRHTWIQIYTQRYEWKNFIWTFSSELLNNFNHMCVWNSFACVHLLMWCWDLPWFYSPKSLEIQPMFSLCCSVSSNRVFKLFFAQFIHHIISMCPLLSIEINANIYTLKQSTWSSQFCFSKCFTKFIP